MNEDLRNWFREKWVRMDTKGNIRGDCAREEGEGKPKCLPLAKASSMSKEKRAAAARRKRREDPVADRPGKGGKPVNVATEEISTSELIKKSHEKRGAPGTLKAKIKGPITLEKVRQLKNRPNATTLDKKQANFYINMHTEEYLEEKNTPTNPSLWSKAKSLAKQKFDVYPSAYANGWAAKWYKSKGGGWKSIQEEKPMKTLRDITESVVVMSDYKLDRKGRKYKAHRKTMGPTAMDIAKGMRRGPQSEIGEQSNPYVNEEGDYPHIGVGTSRDMQMARDIATMKAKTSLLRSIHGDNFQDKTMPDYEEDKLDLKPDQKGGYTATVRMRQKAATVKEDSNPYNESYSPGDPKKHVQGQFINDDDWYVVHNKTKKIVGSRGAKSIAAKQLEMKGGWGARSVKVDDEHTAYRGMNLRSALKEESEQVDEVSKKTLAGYISGAAKDVGYHANLTGFVAGQRKPKGYNPTDESPKELKRHAGIAKALKRLVKESNGQKSMSSLKVQLSKLSDKAVAANRAGDDDAVKAHQRKMNMVKDQMNKLRKEDVEQVDESAAANASKILKDSWKSAGNNTLLHRRSGNNINVDYSMKKEKAEQHADSHVKLLAKHGIEASPKVTKSHRQGIPFYYHGVAIKEDVEQVDEISKATATSYVRKKLSQMGKRSGDTTPKDIDNLSRAYKRMGVSDKAMKEKE